VAVANTLVYYDKLTIADMKSFIIHVPCLSWRATAVICSTM